MGEMGLLGKAGGISKGDVRLRIGYLMTFSASNVYGNEPSGYDTQTFTWTQAIPETGRRNPLGVIPVCGDFRVADLQLSAVYVPVFNVHGTVAYQNDIGILTGSLDTNTRLSPGQLYSTEYYPGSPSAYTTYGRVASLSGTINAEGYPVITLSKKFWSKGCDTSTPGVGRCALRLFYEFSLK